MAEMTRERVQKLTDDEIASSLRTAARFQREHKAITWERGTDLVNIVAEHGDKLADALEEYVTRHL
jgi:hypothetical protein